MTSRVALPANPFAVPDRALAAETLLDAYVIESVITQSDFAVVYRACDRASSQVVAIKEYLPHVLARRNAKGRLTPRSPAAGVRFEQGRSAFVDEAHTLARFEHGSLLRVLRVFEAGGTVYRVMPFSPGPTLLEHRRALGRMPALEDLARWADGLLGALAMLHAGGRVHGAVWPGNIVLRPGERALLLDFDTVRAVLAGHQVPGTMPAPKRCFMAPERLARSADAAPGPWTDLYALAASLHYGICGRLPVAPDAGTGAAAFEPLADHWQRACGALPMPGEAARLFAALEACLAGAPERRPHDVAAFRGWPGVAAATTRRPAAAGDPLPAAAAAVAAAATVAEKTEETEETEEIGEIEQTEARLDVSAPPGAEATVETPSGPDVDDGLTAATDAHGDGRADLDTAADAGGRGQTVAEPRAMPAPELAPELAPGLALEPASHAQREAGHEHETAHERVAAPAAADEPGIVGSPDAGAARLAPRGVSLRRLAGAAALAVGAWLVIGPWWTDGADRAMPAPSPAAPPAPGELIAAMAVVPAAAGAPRQPEETAGADPAGAANAIDATAVEAQTGTGTGTGIEPEPVLHVPVMAGEVPDAGALAAVDVPTVVPPPRVAAARPVGTRRPRADAGTAATASPAQACAGRTGFALYQCTQLACAHPAAAGHALCVELRRSNAVD